MLSDRTKDALGVTLNIEPVADLTRHLTFEQFATDRMAFYAVTGALEIISEASRRLPEDLKARYPRIQCRAIHGAGNVYRHAYGKVSKAEGWDAARKELESRSDILARELDGARSPEPAAPRTNEKDEGSKE